MTTDPSTHVYRYEPTFAAEGHLIERYVEAGEQVLDVGTGGSGRTALLLDAVGARVTSVDLSSNAVAEFRAEPRSQHIGLVTADLRDGPFAASSFDVVFVGFHGFDYLVDTRDRVAALAEVQRLLRPGGRLFVCAFNKTALWVSPRGFRSRASAAARLRYFTRRDAFADSLVDGNGLRLANRTLRSLIVEVETHTDLEWTASVDLDGRERSRRVTELWSIEPYTVFKRPLK